MKNKIFSTIKENINIISFIIILIIFGSVSVYALITFPSNNILYDNTLSGLTSTDVQGAIDELYETCTAPPAGEQIIEAVGLTRDLYEDRYFFTGASPKNYITFSGEEWRILTIEGDGRIKIIKSNSLGDITWDSSGSDDWSRPASLNTYLNDEYKNTLSDKDKIATSMWRTGKIYMDNNNLADQINRERSNAWEGDIALITLSEYIRTNSKPTSCGTFKLSDENYNICKDTTWLSNNTSFWTITTNTDVYERAIYVSYIGSISADDVEGTFFSGPYAVYPTLYLKPNIKIIGGDGSQGNPYQIE